MRSQGCTFLAWRFSRASRLFCPHQQVQVFPSDVLGGSDHPPSLPLGPQASVRECAGLISPGRFARGRGTCAPAASHLQADDANDMWEDQEEDDEEEDGLAGHLLSDILATGKHGMHPWAPGLVRAVSCPGPCPDPPCRCLWQRRTTMRMMRTMTLTP